jgi:predicted amidohydrolase YtcJ
MISVLELHAIADVATDAVADYLRQARQQNTPVLSAG